MELHKCQFFNYAPSAVQAIAFSADGSRVAVARADADIEIWNVQEDWLLEKRIPGASNVTVEALVWTADGRLFSAGQHAVITEWDLLTLQAKTAADSYGGPVWSMAANRAGTLLAVGCEDGCVRLFDLADGGLVYRRSFEPQKGRILSLAWNDDEALLAAGMSNGYVRLFAAATGRSIHRMTCPAPSKTAPPLVWAIAFLHGANAALVASGDSSGNVCVWDSVTGTLVQAVATHDADVLAVVVGEDGQAVYAAGIDHKVVQLRLTSGGSGAQAAPARDAPVTRARIRRASGTQWVIAARKRAHSHDIRALALSPNGTMLVSGGVDTTVIVYSPTALEGTPLRRVLPFPHRSLVSVARTARLLCCQYPHRLDLWRLGTTAATVSRDGLMTGSILPLETRHRKVVEIHPKTGSNIVCSAISDNGHWIAVSDATKLSLYELVHTVEDDSYAVHSVRGAGVDATVLAPAHLLAFAPGSRKLVVGRADGDVAILELVGRDQVTVLRVWDRLPADPTEREATPRESICSLAVSGDGQWLVVGDLSNRILAFHLDTMKYHSTLPRFASQHTAIAFHPASLAVVIACASNHFYIYNVEDARLSDWAREYSEQLPKQLIQRREKITGIAFNPAQPSTVVLTSLGYVCAVDLQKPLPQPDVSLVVGASGKPQRKRAKAASAPMVAEPLPSATEDPDVIDLDAEPGAETVAQPMADLALDGSGPAAADGPTNFRMHVHMQLLMAFDFVGANEAVAVQQPWLAVVRQLPPKLYRPRYGT